MADSRFYDNRGPLSADDIESLTGARRRVGSARVQVRDVAALKDAGPDQLAYCESDRFVGALAQSRGNVFLVTDAHASAVPAGAVYWVSERPAVAFAKVAAALYPDAGLSWPRAHPPTVPIDPTARIGEGSVIAPGAFVGREVEIGRDTIIGHGAVIGRGVRIGSECRIGAHVTLSHSLIGDRVGILPGACIGQDGFRFEQGPQGHLRIPQLGRVLIDDDVEIGSNVAIDRGALGDTVISRGTKVDNLVHIGHNVVVGEHCVLAGQVGLSGSVTLGDSVVLGGQVGVADHRTIGTGATVLGRGGVTKNLEGGQLYGGFPARAVALWRREVAVLARLARGKSP